MEGEEGDFAGFGALAQGVLAHGLGRLRPNRRMMEGEEGAGEGDFDSALSLVGFAPSTGEPPDAAPNASVEDVEQASFPPASSSAAPDVL